jgi:hypothetical protein
MGWFLRAVEADDGTWRCHRGRLVLDTHAAFDEALEHLREVARATPPAILFGHWRDGRVEQIGEVP